MPMTFEKVIDSERQELITVLEKAEKDIRKYEKQVDEKRLVCKRSHNTSQYYLDNCYIPKNKLDIVKPVAQFGYAKAMIKLLEKKKKILDYLKQYSDIANLDAVYEGLCDARKALVIPYVKTEQAFVKEWIGENYQGLGNWENIKNEFYTVKGERVRSKAEMIIANELSSHNIPYKYEQPLELMDGKIKRTIYPDFRVLNVPMRKEIIIEHLGMMDKFSYYNSSLNKVDLLERNGYLLGDRLLLFHETSDNPLNVKVIRKYIKEYLI